MLGVIEVVVGGLIDWYCYGMGFWVVGEFVVNCYGFFFYGVFVVF